MKRKTTYAFLSVMVCLLLDSCGMFSIRDAEDPGDESYRSPDPIFLHSIIDTNSAITFSQQFFDDLLSSSFEFSDEAVSGRIFSRNDLITRINTIDATAALVRLKVVWVQTPGTNDEIIAPPIRLFRNYRIWRDSTSIDTLQPDFTGETIFTMISLSGVWYIDQWHDKPATPSAKSFFNPEYVQ